MALSPVWNCHVPSSAAVALPSPVMTRGAWGAGDCAFERAGRKTSKKTKETCLGRKYEPPVNVCIILVSLRSPRELLLVLSEIEHGRLLTLGAHEGWPWVVRTNFRGGTSKMDGVTSS